MTEQANENRAPEEAEAANTPATDAPEFQADTEAFLRLAKENEELKDRALRLAAEMENLRRRTQRDVADARSYAVTNFARDMLSVSDNLRRALDAIPPQALEAGDAGFKSLAEGVEMTERAMLSALERHGVKKIAPEGERFDPNFHQAMFEVPNSEVPNNTVVQVVQTGYVIGDRVLRPAMVGVAKGGPKAGEAPAQAADTSQAE
ncbi:nucleotide exchange factor GrpE [Tianweitania sediminis]|uniref:Protein GrpE n=1 Tax=Tianweitania sediminis TaxID=1502156 RepID=A0A8J7UI98_9HYPH|nr:nucleotide exchange factor GrpE [Tianweitania sediminis]MBP0437444.1 nucleotide exchange factor GrpE [Tianweitania sediminis]